MRILDVTLKKHGDNVGDKSGPVKSFTLRYTIQGDHGQHTEDEILACPNLPGLYALLRGCRCRKREAIELRTHAKLYAADLDFDSRLDGENEDQQPPENRTPEWSWGGEKIQEVVEFDAIQKGPNDKPLRIATKAGDQIIMTRPRTIPVLTIVRYQLSFSPDIYGTHVDHVNKTPFWGAPARSALLDIVSDVGVTVSDAEGKPVKRRQTTYTVKFNNQRDVEGNIIGWAGYVLHQGEHYLVTAEEAERRKFKDSDQRPRIGNLAADGTKLSDEDNEAGNFDWLTFYPFPEVELNALTLGPFDS